MHCSIIIPIFEKYINFIRKKSRSKINFAIASIPIDKIQQYKASCKIGISINKRESKINNRVPKESLDVKH